MGLKSRAGRSDNCICYNPRAAYRLGFVPFLGVPQQHPGAIGGFLLSPFLLSEVPYDPS